VSHPVTPDDRYFVVRGRLWRMANPGDWRNFPANGDPNLINRNP
jgi:hypothetical protein